ncbi:MAG: glycosyltransferase family 9 protein [Phycisphaerales bacterium]|nr:glycosyltransferase family 9 protein [Phycisphaerales bacterium]
MNGLPDAGRSARRILILKPSSLGDIVHALPMLAALRAARPDAHVAWLAATPFAPLLDGHPLINEVIRFDRGRLGRAWRSPAAAAELLSLMSRLRRPRFDLVIDLQGLFRSGWLAWSSGARVRAGFADGRELSPLFLTHRIHAADALHAVDRNLRIAAALGWPAQRVEFPLGIRDEEVSAARELLRSAGVDLAAACDARTGSSAGLGSPAPPDAGESSGSGGGFVAILPGARWRSKLWRAERWAALIDALAERGRRSVVLGGPGDAEVLRAIEGHARRPIASLVGRTTLRELTAVLSLADRVVCTDSGPMHLAAALGRPVVALFGPTDPQRCGPYSPVVPAPGASFEEAPGANMLQDKAPGTNMLREAPGTNMLREAPGTNMLQDAPGANMLREAPGANMLREAPGAYVLLDEAGRAGVGPAVRLRCVASRPLQVLSGRVPCAACYRRECWHQSCMQRVTPGDVLAALDEQPTAPAAPSRGPIGAAAG